jgi:malate dehydrogenase (oxaloacetate-decarboxylating)(NADP+)
MGMDYPERDRLNLRGLVPPRVKTLAEQAVRAMEQIRAYGAADNQEANIRKNIYLQELHNRNETLYHRVLSDNIAELAPLVYTPTVGVVCQQFGAQFRRARGMYFSREDRGLFSSMVWNWPHDDVHVIVVTDGSRILGLGDLGAHGMGIPIGKLALYCAAGGIAPHRVMPVMLDVGTNNEALLRDPDYVGIPKTRLTGDDYDEMVDEFMTAVFDRWPNVVVQFEDFESSKAAPLLAKYRSKYRCFNDDIQGTGCVTLAGVVAAGRQAGVRLSEMSFLCAGAGSAGLGVCAQIVDGMVEDGLSRDEALSRFVICTSVGAIGKADGKYGDPNASRGLSEERAVWVNEAVSDGASLLEVTQQFKPTCLLGLAAQPGGLFTKEMVSGMLEYTETPIVMPMSNPTAKHECTPAQAYEWTRGKAVVATGSPFDPVTMPDGKTLIPSQCNNMYVFPGIGLAASVAGVKEITDPMLYAAAVACVDAMTPEEFASGRTFPAIDRIREVSHLVACRVIEVALQEGLTTKIQQKNIDEAGSLEELVTSKMYDPKYVPLVDPSK